MYHFTNFLPEVLTAVPAFKLGGRNGKLEKSGLKKIKYTGLPRKENERISMENEPPGKQNERKSIEIVPPGKEN